MIPKVNFKRILTAASVKLFNTEGKCEKVFFITVEEEHAVLLYRRDRTMVVYEKISLEA